MIPANMGVASLTIEVEIMKKTAIALTLGLGLAVTGFAQSAAKPKGRPSAAKPAASPKAKPPKIESLRPASEPTIVKAKPRLSQLFMALDANKDGKLSLKEIEAAVKAFKKLDKNKDGELTLAEFGPAPDVDKPEPRSIGKPGGVTPRVATKPSRRPTARPSGRPGSKPKGLASRTTGARKPSAKSTRPSARPRPSGRPGRRVAKTGAARGTSAKASGAAATGRAKPKRVVRKSPALKKTKPASRRRPAPKPTTPPANAGSSVNADLKALIEETEAITKQIKQALAKIKNLAKKQAAMKWIRIGSRKLLNTLGKELEGQGADNKAGQVEEAKQKLNEVRKLLE